MNFTFVTTSGSSYVSLEADASGIKVGCLGMGRRWHLSDHTWDYVLDSATEDRIAKLIDACGLLEWDECYAADDFPDLQWEVILERDGRRFRSFGNGMKSPGYDILEVGIRSLVTDLSKEIYIDMEPLEAVYFCYVRNGINCTFTVYRDLESKLEKTGVGEVSSTLSQDDWGKVVGQVRGSGIPLFGFSLTEGSQFASRALYLGGKMVSCTLGGSIPKEWGEFEEKLLSIAFRQVP